MQRDEEFEYSILVVEDQEFNVQIYHRNIPLRLIQRYPDLRAEFEIQSKGKSRIEADKIRENIVNKKCKIDYATTYEEAVDMVKQHFERYNRIYKIIFLDYTLATPKNGGEVGRWIEQFEEERNITPRSEILLTTDTDTNDYGLKYARQKCRKGSIPGLEEHFTRLIGPDLTRRASLGSIPTSTETIVEVDIPNQKKSSSPKKGSPTKPSSPRKSGSPTKGSKGLSKSLGDNSFGMTDMLLQLGEAHENRNEQDLKGTECRKNLREAFDELDSADKDLKEAASALKEEQKEEQKNEESIADEYINVTPGVPRNK